MLTQVSIRGLAIIEELHIDFSSELNVITGETGAGKSILIKALHLLLGAKADPEVIRTGFTKAFVSGAFVLPRSHPSIAILDENGLWHDEQEQTELIIRREIASKGRSQAWVNDQAVTLALLKEIGHSLIDIYGQHENHRMLEASTHLEYIDAFLADKKSKFQLQETMVQVAQSLQELRRTFETYFHKKREQDFLQFRFQELSQFAPDEQEYQELKSFCEELNQRLLSRKQLMQAQQLCDEGFDGRSISAALRELRSLLHSKAEGKIASEREIFSKNLDELSAFLDELSYALGLWLNKELIDDEAIEQAQARLSQYQQLMRKMGVRSVQELVETFQSLSQELALVTEGPEQLGKILQQLGESLEQADVFAKSLSQDRRKAAKKAIALIESELHDLNMKGAKISFDFQPVHNQIAELALGEVDPELEKQWLRCLPILTETGRFGREKGQFLLAANRGDTLRPLAKVASGGEVSRIMLGFKKALAMGAQTCVMVFDEIDTGISGQTAHIVGRKLRQLSRHFQVICISHLPQVAVYGDAHFRVEKSQVGDSTESRILKLDKKASEEEIARLLSGDHVTQSSLHHAKQLIRAAREVVEAKGPS